MIKNIFIALILSVIAVSLQAQVILTENETTASPNNTLQTAMIVDNQYTRISGYINYSGDIDYYKIEVPAGKTVMLKFLNITRDKMQPAGTVLDGNTLDSCIAANLSSYVLKTFVDGQSQNILISKINRTELSNCLIAALTTDVSFKTYDLARVSIYDTLGNIIIPSDNYESYSITNEGNTNIYYNVCMINPIGSPLMAGSYMIDISR